MPTVLIADDEKSIRKTLREILEYESYKVDEAEDGALDEAVRHFDQGDRQCPVLGADRQDALAVAAFFNSWTVTCLTAQDAPTPPLLKIPWVAGLNPFRS